MNLRRCLVSKTSDLNQTSPLPLKGVRVAFRMEVSHHCLRRVDGQLGWPGGLEPLYVWFTAKPPSLGDWPTCAAFRPLIFERSEKAGCPGSYRWTRWLFHQQFAPTGRRRVSPKRAGSGSRASKMIIAQALQLVKLFLRANCEPCPGTTPRGPPGSSRSLRGPSGPSRRRGAS